MLWSSCARLRDLEAGGAPAPDLQLFAFCTASELDLVYVKGCVKDTEEVLDEPATVLFIVQGHGVVLLAGV